MSSAWRGRFGVLGPLRRLVRMIGFEVKITRVVLWLASLVGDDDRGTLVGDDAKLEILVLPWSFRGMKISDRV